MPESELTIQNVATEVRLESEIGCSRNLDEGLRLPVGGVSDARPAGGRHCPPVSIPVAIRRGAGNSITAAIIIWQCLRPPAGGPSPVLAESCSSADGERAHCGIPSSISRREPRRLRCCVLA